MLNKVSQSSHENGGHEKKRALDSQSVLNGIQPLDSNKKTKTQLSTVNAATLRGARLCTSQPYATGIQSVQSGDILLGRGGSISAHFGNTHLRDLITHGSPTVAPIDFQTHAQLKKSEKKQIWLDLLQEVHSTIPRRRFLQQNKQDSLYYEVHDERAILKIAQTIRDLRSKRPKNETTSTENKSAHISQYALLDNHQDIETIPVSLATSNEDDHMRELLNYPYLNIFLDCFSEDHNMPTLRNNPSLNLLLDNVAEDDNDQKPAAAPIEHQTSQLAHHSKSWTIEDDRLLIAEKSKLDQASAEESRQWSHLSELIPQHAPKAIRERWVNHLNPILNKTPFSDNEYDQIKTGIEKYGKRWTQISQEIFGSKRAENDIKNQFHCVRFKNHIINRYGIQTYNDLTSNRNRKKS